MSTSHAVEPAHDTEAELIGTGIALTRILLDMLDDELSLMLARDAQALEDLVFRKQRLVDDLKRIEPLLLERLRTESPVDPDSELGRLRGLMLEGRDKNRRNQTVAITGLRNANQSLSLLRSMLDMDDLALYDSEGALLVSREKRRLGEL